MPLKILAVGDVHGKDVLTRLDPSCYDKIIFLGDYVDPPAGEELSDLLILENLERIIAFKAAQHEKVVLLLGNHDVHYMYPEEAGICSGFRPQMFADLRAIYRQNAELFRMAFQYQTYLFTHAGISNRWLHAYEGLIRQELQNITSNDPSLTGLSIAEILNHLRSTARGRQILFTVSGLRIYPPDPGISGGIIWADKRETEHDCLTGYHQVVGHTVVGSIERISDPGDSNTSITYVDTGGREFLELTL
ncbi:metallophosphoesterase [Flavihumibacter sp. R14]|nr:metallophosphoesterase [Flavihumibacter soli]